MILVTGSLAYDQILNFPGQFAAHIMPEKIHMLNVSFLVNKMRKGFGGTAGNISYSLSLLGIKTALLGVVGADFLPYKEFLDQHEIDTSHLLVVNTFFTSTAIGITDKRDNHIWGFYTGADTLSDKLSLGEIRQQIDFGIIAPHNPRAMIKFAQEYKQKRIDYMFDPGMQLPWLSRMDLSIGIEGAKILIVNDYEMSVVKAKFGLTDTDTIGRKNQIIITTLADRGSEIVYQGTVYHIPPAKARNSSDPAGAGDAYRAGFIAGYLRKFPIEVCGRMGSVSAVYTVEKYGTTTHSYTLDQFSRRYEENFGEMLTL